MDTDSYKAIVDSIGSLSDKLENKIDRSNTILFGKIDEIQKDIGGKDGIRERLVSVEAKQDSMETQMGAFITDHEFLRGDLADINGKLPQQPCEDLKDHKTEHIHLEIERREFKKRVWKTALTAVGAFVTIGGLIYKFWPSN